MNATSTRVCAGLSVIPLLALSLATFPERGSAQESPDDLSLTVGKSALVSSDKPIERVSVGFGESPKPPLSARAKSWSMARRQVPRA
jgi:hypothetical protein